MASTTHSVQEENLLQDNDAAREGEGTHTATGGTNTPQRPTTGSWPSLLITTKSCARISTPIAKVTTSEGAVDPYRKT